MTYKMVPIYNCLTLYRFAVTRFSVPKSLQKDLKTAIELGPVASKADDPTWLKPRQ